MHIWLALRFPLFKLEALEVDIEHEACVIASSQKKVCAATALCWREGIKIDMPVTTAQALMSCVVHTRDQDKEQDLLQRVCDVLYAFTPYIQSYYPNTQDESGDQGLLLELSRCTRLFGGGNKLLYKITEALSTFGVCFQWSMSTSAKAAWLLSAQPLEKPDFDDVLNIKTRDLDEFPEAGSALEEMGFLGLRDVKKHIDSEGLFSLQKRFDTATIQYLLDILSVEAKDSSIIYSDTPFDIFSNAKDTLIQEELFSSSHTSYRAIKPSVIYEPETDYNDSLSFDFPLVSLELLHEPMQQLLKNLSEYLIVQQKQCGGIQWRFSDIYQNREILDVRCELVYRDWQLLYELSLIKLEQGGLPFEVDQLELINPSLIDAVLNTSELAISKEHAVSDNRARQRIVTKIKARLGDTNVFKVSYKDDHFPECAQRNIDVEEPALQKLEHEHRHAIRPGWILNTPIAIGKNQNDLSWNGRVELIRGPERLQGHWWDKPTARDYFVAVREDQVRLWVFNDLFREEWFVQGVF